MARRWGSSIMEETPFATARAPPPWNCVKKLGHYKLLNRIVKLATLSVSRRALTAFRLLRSPTLRTQSGHHNHHHPARESPSLVRVLLCSVSKAMRLRLVAVGEEQERDQQHRQLLSYEAGHMPATVEVEGTEAIGEAEEEAVTARTGKTQAIEEVKQRETSQPDLHGKIRPWRLGT